MRRQRNWAWYKTKQEFKARCKAANAPCWLTPYGECRLGGEPINYNAPPLAPDSFEPDHYHPVRTRPDLEHELSNLRACHSRCNRSRQAKAINPEAVWAAADW